MKWYYFWVYIIAFSQVALLNFQARNAAQGRTLLAMLTSLVLSTFGVFLIRSFIGDNMAAASAIFGGGLGAGFGIEMHKRFLRKKS